MMLVLLSVCLRLTGTLLQWSMIQRSTSLMMFICRWGSECPLAARRSSAFLTALGATIKPRCTLSLATNPSVSPVPPSSTPSTPRLSTPPHWITTARSSCGNSCPVWRWNLLGMTSVQMIYDYFLSFFWAVLFFTQPKRMKPSVVLPTRTNLIHSYLCPSAYLQP